MYAAYSGVYIAVAMAWLWKVDRVPITLWDVTGAAVSVIGMASLFGVDEKCNAHDGCGEPRGQTKRRV